MSAFSVSMCLMNYSGDYFIVNCFFKFVSDFFSDHNFIAVVALRRVTNQFFISLQVLFLAHGKCEYHFNTIIWHHCFSAFKQKI